MSVAPDFLELIESIMRDGSADRVSGTVRVRAVEPVDPDSIGPDDRTIVHDSFATMRVREFGYRVMRRDDVVRCESLDGNVLFIAGRYRVWIPDASGRPQAKARTEERFSVPDDLQFGVARPRPDRWDGDDFTRPIGAPVATTFLGRPAWTVDLAPPPHKPYELTMVVDDRTGLVLRQANDGFGSFHEWTELDTAADLPVELFEWVPGRDAPVPPVETIERSPSAHEVDGIDDRLRVLDVLAIAIDRRDEVVAVIGGAVDAAAARAELAELLGVTELEATAVVDLQLRRLARRERARLDEERQHLRAVRELHRP